MLTHTHSREVTSYRHQSHCLSCQTTARLTLGWRLMFPEWLSAEVEAKTRRNLTRQHTQWPLLGHCGGPLMWSADPMSQVRAGASWRGYQGSRQIGAAVWVPRDAVWWSNKSTVVTYCHCTRWHWCYCLYNDNEF